MPRNWEVIEERHPGVVSDLPHMYMSEIPVHTGEQSCWLCIHATLLYTQRSTRNNTQKFYFPKAMQLQAVMVCGVPCRAFWSITVNYPSSFTKQHGPHRTVLLLGELMAYAYTMLLLQAATWIFISFIPPRHLSPKYSVITSKNKI